MSRLTAVFFDLDDTLYDFKAATHEELVVRLGRLLGPENGERVPEALEAYEAIREDTWQEYLQGLLSFPEVRVVRFQRTLERLGLSRPAPQVWEEADAFISGWLQRIKPFPGVRELLEELQGRVTLGVITNGEPSQTIEKLELLGLSHFFRGEQVLASKAVGLAKPDKAIFDLALLRAGAEADQAVMVGDSFEADVLGALGAGWRGAVWLNREGRPVPDLGAEDSARLRVAGNFKSVRQEIGVLQEIVELW